MDISNIPQLFGLDAANEVKPLGNGHINSTYHAVCGGSEYVIQSLSSEVFSEPEAVMVNISKISAAFQKNPQKNIRIPEYICADGKNYAIYGGKLWRIYKYIPAKTEHTDLYSAGAAFGTFIRVLSIEKTVLRPVISGFHEFGRYYSRLSELASGGKMSSSVMTRFEQLSHMFSGIFTVLPMRCIHGDAKLENVITGEVGTVIDIDTAMNGWAAVDYGDMIRSVCRKGIISDAVKTATIGFCNGMNGLLNADETASLYYGILYVTGELAMRYFIDFASGERYFKDKTPEQCYSRANELLSELDAFIEREGELKDIICDAFRN